MRNGNDKSDISLGKSRYDKLCQNSDNKSTESAKDANPITDSKNIASSGYETIKGMSVKTAKIAEEIEKNSKSMSYILKLDMTENLIKEIDHDIINQNKKVVSLNNDYNDLSECIFDEQKRLRSIDYKFQCIAVEFGELLKFYIGTTEHPGWDVLEKKIRAKFAKKKTKKEGEDDSDAVENILSVLRDVQTNYSKYWNSLEVKTSQINALIDDRNKIVISLDAEEKVLEELYKKKSKALVDCLATLFQVNTDNLKLDDIIINDKLRNQLKKLIREYENEKDIRNIPKGILFFGEKDSGKAYTAKILASETGRKMYHIKEYDILGSNTENPSSALYTILNNIIDKIKEEKKPAIIYFDEVERFIQTNIVDYSGEGARISNILLQNIENIIKSDLDVVVICGISKRNNLDERFLNYEYLKEQFYFDGLGVDESKGIFEMHLKSIENKVGKKVFSEDAIEDIASKSDGLTPKHIERLMYSLKRDFLFNQKDNEKYIITNDMIKSKINELREENKMKQAKIGFIPKI